MEILAVAITGCFGLFIAWQNYLLSRRTKTNHGRTIGQHVEDTAASAQDAKLTAQLVSLQLQEYKNEQAAAHAEDQRRIEGYVNADASAHAEIRALILQVATSAARNEITKTTGG